MAYTKDTNHIKSRSISGPSTTVLMTPYKNNERIVSGNNTYYIGKFVTTNPNNETQLQTSTICNPDLVYEMAERCRKVSNYH